MTARRWRVLSNLSGLRHDAMEVEVVKTGATGMARWRAAVALARRCARADAILLNCAIADTLALCAVLRVMPWVRVRVIVSDAVMNPPIAPFPWLRAVLKRFLLRRVDHFVVHQRDLDAYARWYGITPSRSTFIPFKVNLMEVIERLTPSEGDYLFACGVTNRDWPVLGAATRGRPYPVVVSMPDRAQLERMGAIGIAPRPADFGPTARFVENGADPAEWLTLAAGARVIVLPVTPSAINPSGVSTYLSLMALGKCLVISDGPATRGIVTDEAIVVPPGDAEQLGAAIDRAWSDEGLRRATAQRGQVYARSLGDAGRLMRDLAGIVVTDLQQR